MSNIKTFYMITRIIVYHLIANASCLLIIYLKKKWDLFFVNYLGRDSFIACI